MTCYDEFLQKKRVVDIPSGHEPGKLHPDLFPFQRDIVRWALRRGRAAIFADCGLGKTLMQLEWSRHVNEKTNGKILILAPLAVSLQTKREGKKFQYEVNVCRSQRDVKDGINITNYENLHKFDPSAFSGVVLDESSIIKSFEGIYRNLIIQSFSNCPYRLACTATPSPNDFMELGNHSEFLGILTRVEMLSMFFINDTSDTGTWRLKGHAEEQFWKWLCSWAVMIKAPSDLGYDDNGFILPPLTIKNHVVEFGRPLPGNLFIQTARTLDERREARKLSTPARTAKVAKLVNGNGDQWLIWVNLNTEGEEARKLIPDAVEIKGADDPETKTQRMLDFTDGKIRVLVTKPKIAGFGMNWQHCSNVAFLGLSDSYESFYQAIRRCWRFGQKNEVFAHVVTADVEGEVVANIQRKETKVSKLHTEMVKHMADLTRTELSHATRVEIPSKGEVAEGNNWKLYLGDCVEWIKELQDASIDYSIFSPPFASLFTYTASERDMGNCRNDAEFFEHFNFLIQELRRVMVPGRLVSIHCMNLPYIKYKDGFLGMRDFRGDIIRAFQGHGFIYHSEVCIWKDPLVQATRTKKLELAHKQICKDSTVCAQGFPDYIVTVRTPGENPRPVSRGRGFEKYIGSRPEPKNPKDNNPKRNKYSHYVWQRYASPVWFDIRQTRTLNERLAREERDERHIAPLQLDVVERCIELWTNPGDLIFTPFAGIGTELYVAIQAGRRAIGIELKESYYREAINNLRSIENGSQAKLF